MNILVTGSAGFVGAELIPQLQALGHRVVGIDRRAERQSDLPLTHDLRVPLPAALRELVSAHAPEVCVHLASPVGGFLFNARQPQLPAYQEELDASLIELCRVCDCRRIVFTSTINVFEAERTFAHAPLARFDQRTPYAIAKAASERRFSAAFRHCTVLRPTNIYGKSQSRSHHRYGESHVIPDLLRKLRTDGPLEVLGDGSQRRNFVHVSDVCRFIASRIAARGKQHLNLRSRLSLSIHDLARQLIRASGSERPIRFRPEFLRHEQFAVPDFDLAAASNQGWLPRVHDLAEGLRL